MGLSLRNGATEPFRLDVVSKFRSPQLARLEKDWPLPWAGWNWRWTKGVGLTAALLLSCTDTSPPAFALVQVTPSTVPNRVATPAIVEGSNFHNFAKVRLGDNNPSTIEREWEVSVDGVRLRRDQTRRIDVTSLAIVLPAGLPLGIHDLSVTDPRGHSRTLTGALTVIDDSGTPYPTTTGGATSIGTAGTTSRSDGGRSGKLLSSGGTGPMGGTTSSPTGGTQAAGGTTSSATGGAQSAAGTAGTAGGGQTATNSNCRDGIQNGSETEVDCGGAQCPACVCQLADFSAPGRITLSDRADIAVNAALWGPTLSADGLTMFFVAGVGTTERIYQTTRTTKATLTFANTTAVFPGVTDNRGTPALSYDGLTLYFYSDGLGGKGGRDIWSVTRQTLTTAFALPQSIAAVNTATKDHLPWLSADELNLYYATEPLGNSEIWMTQRLSPLNPFAAGTPVAELNSSNNDSRLALTSDGRVAYIVSDRAQPGNYDIWVATRSTGGKFSAPTLVPTLNSTTNDMDVALSRDNTELFFVSARAGTAFIYRALRQCN